MALLVIILFLIVTYLLAKKDLIWGVSWLAFLVTAYLVRINILGISLTALELGIYLIFGLFVLKVWRGQAKLKWRNFYLLPILWLAIGLISALFVAGDKIAALGLWKGWILDPILMFLVVANSLRYRSQMNFLYLGFIFLLGMMGFLAIWQFATGTTITMDGRVSTFFSSANYLAMLLVPYLLLILAKFLKEKKAKWIEIIFWLMGLFALILTASYVGLMSFLLGGLFLSWSVYTKSVKSFLLVILGAIVLAGFFLYLQPDPDRFRQMIDLSERSSVTVRVQVWEVAVRLIGEHGVWGIGLGGFQNAYFNIIGSMFDPPLEWKMLHAHNLYLHTWLEMTLFGLVVLLAVILSVWSRAINLLKSVDYYWLYGVLAILLAWVIGGFFDITYYKNDLSFIFWLMAALIIGTTNIYGKSMKGGK